jgi:hypothetical protein
MESLPDRSGPSRSTPSTQRRGGKLQRMTQETRGIVEDLREWTDLKIDLAVREINDSLDDAASQLALGVTLAVLAFFTGLFGLTTAALGIGWALGRPFWGFLIVFGVLLAVSGVVAVVTKRHPIVVETKLFRKLRGHRTARDSSVTDDSASGSESRNTTPDTMGRENVNRDNSNRDNSNLDDSTPA